ncbi:MAG TPA: helix-turn-helix domain-containing protein [Paludibacteraceae bacterium]|nr:helix-turn-helix domain-containing protein [Paludibacteraceae bacterium]
MTHYDIDKIVARRFGITVRRLTTGTDRRKATIARAMAVMLCYDVLKLSTLKLKKIYGKQAHSTIIENIQTARNLAETNRGYRTILDACRHEIEMKSSRSKIRKQCYNLHYRIREKGIRIDSKQKTISVTEGEMIKISDRQTRRLIDRYHYSIQLSLL